MSNDEVVVVMGKGDEACETTAREVSPGMPGTSDTLSAAGSSVRGESGSPKDAS